MGTFQLRTLKNYNLYDYLPSTHNVTTQNEKANTTHRSKISNNKTIVIRTCKTEKTLHVLFYARCVISVFLRDADQIFALLGYYSASSGSSVPTFRDNQSAPSCRIKKFNKTWTTLTLQRWGPQLPRNVGTELPLDVA